MNLDDLTTKIKEWTNREDLTNPQIEGFVRLGEENLNEVLRIKDMVQIDTATISDRRVLLPEDWIEADFIRNIDGKPLRYISRDDFYAIGEAKMCGKYTLAGNYVVFGGQISAVDGLKVEMHYYGNVPTLKDKPTWLSKLYPSLQLYSALSFAFAYLLEDEKAAAALGKVNDTVDKLNSRHLTTKASGSLINRRQRRSYG